MRDTKGEQLLFNVEQAIHMKPSRTMNWRLLLLSLATLSSLNVLSESDDKPVGCKVDVVNEILSVYLKLRGSINVDAEHDKIKKKMEDVKIQCDGLKKKQVLRDTKTRSQPIVVRTMKLNWRHCCKNYCP